MLLNDAAESLAKARSDASRFLAIKNPENDDYIYVEQSLQKACLTALIGTNEYFFIDSIVSSVSMDKELMQVLTRIEDKLSFRAFCKTALKK